MRPASKTEARRLAIQASPDPLRDAVVALQGRVIELEAVLRGLRHVEDCRCAHHCQIIEETVGR